MSRLCTRRKSRSSLRAGIAAAAATLAGIGAAWAGGYPERFQLGGPATLEEVRRAAIAIPPDGRGLPPGKGDWAAGQKVYDTQCAACHGEDLQGRVGFPSMPQGAALRLTGGRGTLATLKPVFTVESYWPYATTLFDYTRRAMPFHAPGTLTDDQVYAVTAYILAEAKIIECSAVMSAETLPKVQMPNRDGFISDPRPELYK